MPQFSRDHHAWLVRIETRDRETSEDVISGEAGFEAIEYDLEDQHNPRINVLVRVDNKLIKHILFRPSRLTLQTSAKGLHSRLDVTTLNTDTIVRVYATGSGGEATPATL